MFIPTINDNFCPTSLVKRSFTGDVTSTADAFKHWDTCMDNKTCKIIAIVGIVLAALVVMWAFSTLIRCICLGFSCLEALCCCCCRSASKDYNQQQVHPYNNPNMYAPAAQPMYQPVQPSYTPPHNQQPSIYSSNGYKVVDERDDPFKDHHYRGQNF